MLDAAWEVFAERTYDGATVEDIASGAEISVGTLYQLFRSKDDVYMAMVARQQRRFFEVVNSRVDAAEGPREQIHAAIAAHMELFAEYRVQWRLYVTASSGFSRELKDELSRSVMADHLAFLSRLTEICRRGLDARVFRSGVPVDLMAAAVLWLPHSFLAYIFDHDDADVSSLLAVALEAADRVVGTT